MSDEAAPAVRPWTFVVAFGVVSLLADMVYEGARSIIGPYLATLGASATVVGTVAGVGEFLGYGLRIASGYAVSRSRHYWGWTIAGYALTVLCVPAIGATGLLLPALLLYGGERVGKAVRSPAKDTLLSFAAARTGRGAAFGIHQALDQTGAVLGPLLLAAVLAWRPDDYRLAFAVLLVPGIGVLAVLAVLRRRVPDPRVFEDEADGTDDVDVAVPSGFAPVAAPTLERRSRLLRPYIAVVGLLSAGVASFPLLAFHVRTHGLLGPALVPVLFAVAMAVDGAAGPLIGRLYDRQGARVLLIVPFAGAGSALTFGGTAALVWVGIAAWALVNGVLDSTVKAVVADLVPGPRRAVAYGWLALARGAALIVAGVVLGAAYDLAPHWAALLVVAVNAAALVGLVVLLPRLSTSGT